MSKDFCFAFKTKALYTYTNGQLCYDLKNGNYIVLIQQNIQIIKI